MASRAPAVQLGSAPLHLPRHAFSPGSQRPRQVFNVSLTGFALCEVASPDHLTCQHDGPQGSIPHATPQCSSVPLRFTSLTGFALCEVASPDHLTCQHDGPQRFSLTRPRSAARFRSAAPRSRASPYVKWQALITLHASMTALRARHFTHCSLPT